MDGEKVQFEPSSDLCTPSPILKLLSRARSIYSQFRKANRKASLMLMSEIE